MREGATRLSQLPSVLNRRRSIIDFSELLNESLCSGNRANLISSPLLNDLSLRLRCSGLKMPVGIGQPGRILGLYSIDLWGPLHTNEVPDILRRLGFFLPN